MAIVKNKPRPAKLDLSKAPLVVGTVSSSDFKLSAKAKASCDVLEFRLDQMLDVENWLERCQTIEARGVPVLLTIRLKSEGGGWNETDAARLPLFAKALGVVSAVDVELRSEIAKEVSALAKKRGKHCVVSYHDFTGTPSLATLKRVVRKGEGFGSIVKVTTMTKSRAELATLEKLLAGRHKKPLCVMGMGKRGAEARVKLAMAGSCLIYGYLDKPAAPGQSSAAELLQRLRDSIASNKTRPPRIS